MRQTSLLSSPQTNRSSANVAGKNGRQFNAPSTGPAVLQAAADKKKKPASMKEDAQLAADKKKKPASMKAETSQFADDKKKKPASMKAETSQFADDKKKKPASMKAETSQFADDKKKKPASMKAAPTSSSPNKMPEHVQQKMESTMNADFSNVNIHVGSKASSVGALAYTQGNDIHFAQGKFNPNTQSGQNLLGHELAHVVQQRAGRVKATTSVNGLPVNDDRSLEKEADVMGAKAASAK
jgi:hypothetical protein